jgi:hypothetical protein
MDRPVAATLPAQISTPASEALLPDWVFYIGVLWFVHPHVCTLSVPRIKFDKVQLDVYGGMMREGILQAVSVGLLVPVLG